MFIKFANFYWRFILDFSKIATLFISILKTSSQPCDTLPVTGIDNSKVVGNSGGNDKKSAKFDFTKPVHRAEEPSFLTPNTKQAFT